MTFSIFAAPFGRNLSHAIIALAVASTFAGAALADTTVRLIYNPNLPPAFAKARPDLFADPLKKEGIDVEWVEVQGTHAPSIAAVLGGSADLTFGGALSVALASAANGQDIRIAGTFEPNILNGGIIVHGDTGINSVADLKGKTVAVNRGGFGELTLVTALEKAGLNRDDVNFVYLSLDDGATAFASNQVDAYTALSYRTQSLLADFPGSKLIFDVDKDLTADERAITGNSNAFITSKEFADAHGPELIKVLQAYKTVTDWVDANPDEAFEILVQAVNLPEKLRGYAREKFSGYQFDVPPTEADLDRLQKASDFLFANGVLPQAVDVRTYYIKF